jgi:hypothetical protein
VDELLQKHWNRTAGAIEETGLPVVQTPVQAACSCNSGIPVQNIVVNGKKVTIVALPIIFKQLMDSGNIASEETAQELLKTVKVYNPIPSDEENDYATVLVFEYLAFIRKQKAGK